MRQLHHQPGRNANGAPSNLTPEQQARFVQNADYWEAERFRKYRGGDCPPTVFDFVPPFLFDCRLHPVRRMGIGDQICLLAAIQTVADRVGSDNVRVWYDAAYPGSADVFVMGGLDASDPGDTPLYPAGYAVIPCRGHIMEAPIGDRLPAPYGEQHGNPVRQVYYNLGWHGLFCDRAIRLRLIPSAAALARALAIAEQHAGGKVTCTPLEVSRHNNDCDSIVWRNVLLRYCPHASAIMFGCSMADRPEMEQFVGAMALPHSTEIITEALPVWKALVDLSDCNFTGNTAGMWLAIGSHARTCVLQHSDPAHRHNRMWDCKPGWGCKNIEVVNV